MSYLCLPELREGVGGDFVLNIELGKIEGARQNALEGAQSLDVYRCDRTCVPHLQKQLGKIVLKIPFPQYFVSKTTSQ